MYLLKQAKYLLRISSSNDIVRRYFVVNGFDGALTMLGLIIGFILSVPADLTVIINACLGAAIALGMSGLSSAYVSETAERKRALEKLEEAMVSDLTNSAHGEAARLVPWIVALVNGMAPLIISLLILMPLLLVNSGMDLPVAPLYCSITIAFLLVFLLGVYLGRIGNVSWIRSGFQTLLLAAVTAALIYFLAG